MRVLIIFLLSLVLKSEKRLIGIKLPEDISCLKRSDNRKSSKRERKGFLRQLSFSLEELQMVFTCYLNKVA